MLNQAATYLAMVFKVFLIGHQEDRWPDSSPQDRNRLQQVHSVRETFHVADGVGDNVRIRPRDLLVQALPCLWDGSQESGSDSGSRQDLLDETCSTLSQPSQVSNEREGQMTELSSPNTCTFILFPQLFTRSSTTSSPSRFHSPEFRTHP